MYHEYSFRVDLSNQLFVMQKVDDTILSCLIILCAREPLTINIILYCIEHSRKYNKLLIPRLLLSIVTHQPKKKSALHVEYFASIKHLRILINSHQ